MTWVAGLLGYSYLHIVADLRMHTPEGPIDDLGVAKIRAVSRNTLIGFAGSVPIGLDVTASMCGSVGSFVVDGVFPVDVWLSRWIETLQAEYEDRYPAELRAQGLEIVLVGVSEKPGQPPRAYAHVLDLPRPGEHELTVEWFGDRGSVFSIGAGADHDELVSALDAEALLLPTSEEWGESNPVMLHGLFAEKRLQETIRAVLGEQGDVAPLLVSGIVDINGHKFSTLNPGQALPPVLGTWDEVQAALMGPAP